MSQVFAIVLTSSLTLIGGVVLLVVGDVLKRFLIEPIYRFALIRGKIANDLVVYADVITNPGIDTSDRLSKTQKVLRRDSAQLYARASAIPWYRVWRWLGLLPKQKDIELACLLLIGLSNSVHRNENGARNDQDRLEVLRCVGYLKRKSQEKTP